MWKTCGVAAFLAPFSGAIQYTTSCPAGFTAVFVASVTAAESRAVSLACSATSGAPAVVGLVPLQHDDARDLGADRDDPGDRGEQAKPRGGGLLPLRRAPSLSDVGIVGRLVVGHVRPPYRDFARRLSASKPSAGGRSVLADPLAILTNRRDRSGPAIIAPGLPVWEIGVSSFPAKLASPAKAAS